MAIFFFEQQHLDSGLIQNPLTIHTPSLSLPTHSSPNLIPPSLHHRLIGFQHSQNHGLGVGTRGHRPGPVCRPSGPFVQLTDPLKFFLASFSIGFLVHVIWIDVDRLMEKAGIFVNAHPTNLKTQHPKLPQTQSMSKTKIFCQGQATSSATPAAYAFSMAGQQPKQPAFGVRRKVMQVSKVGASCHVADQWIAFCSKPARSYWTYYSLLWVLHSNLIRLWAKKVPCEPDYVHL